VRGRFNVEVGDDQLCDENLMGSIRQALAKRLRETLGPHTHVKVTMDFDCGPEPEPEPEPIPEPVDPASVMANAYGQWLRVLKH
jgi:hypothetical protein